MTGGSYRYGTGKYKRLCMLHRQSCRCPCTSAAYRDQEDRSKGQMCGRWRDSSSDVAAVSATRRFLTRPSTRRSRRVSFQVSSRWQRTETDESRRQRTKSLDRRNCQETKTLANKRERTKTDEKPRVRLPASQPTRSQHRCSLVGWSVRLPAVTRLAAQQGSRRDKPTGPVDTHVCGVRRSRTS